MKAVVNKKELSRILNLAAKCLEKRTVVPILTSFHLQFEPGCLFIRATNLDQTLEAGMEANTKDEFELCVDGRLLSQIVARADEETLNFKFTDKGNFVLERECGNIQLRTQNAEDFPNCPDIEKVEDFIKFETVHLRKAFQAALLGTVEDKNISTSMSNVAELSFDKTLIEGQFKLASTDGYRFSVVTGVCDFGSENPIKYQLPIYAVRLLAASLSELEKEFPKTSIGVDENNIFFKFDKTLHYSFRKTSADFPDWRTHFSKLNFDRSLTVSANVFLKALETAALLSDDRTQGVKCEVEDTLIKLSACNAHTGELEEVIQVKGQCAPFTAGYALNYLIPILRRLGGELEINFAEDRKMIGGKEDVAYTLKIKPQPNGVTENYYIQSRRI